jgi:hypothetical protein
MAKIPADAMSVIERAAENGRDSLTYLDPGRPENRATIEHFLDRSGKGAGRYPALHEAIGAGGVATPNSAVDSCALLDAGRAPDGTATARAWVSSDGGAFISGAHTALLDSESGTVLASGSRTQVGGGLVQGGTDPAESVAATPGMTAVTFFHAQRSPGEPARFGLSVAPVAGREGAVNKHSLEAPIEVKGKQPGYVVIAIARDADHPNNDSDYRYPSAVNVEPDRLVVPCVGNVEFSESVKAKPTAASTRLYSVAAGTTSELREPATLLAGFSAPEGNSLKWSFPFDNKPIKETASLQFKPLDKVDDNVTAFFFQFQVLLGDAENPETVTICSRSWPPPHTANCIQIDSIKYWWHCADGSASVTLADRSKKPLIEVTDRDELLLPDGSTAEVEATTLDEHDELSDDPTYKLETDGGLSLVLSALHPVFVSGAPVKAEDLRVGATIEVEGGTHSVTKCEPTPYSGALCNLLLAGAPAVRGFYANGIAIGDYDALTANAEATRHDLDYMLERLPESQHTDFRSALADATSV